ncbi:hypothetical protein PoB_003933500 [Plakobranchus ocellatus]|uniref:Uncharacterized protein n=1 Tax=Plakobranchus ocellatus TaxID=259542 RepID=A0AAV4AZW0_9GAST|nr:hypothetical protein PoB_003933500 [Plakobranchus ocellatus]
MNFFIDFSEFLKEVSSYYALSEKSFQNSFYNNSNMIWTRDESAPQVLLRCREIIPGSPEKILWRQDRDVMSKQQTCRKCETRLRRPVKKEPPAREERATLQHTAWLCLKFCTI